MLKEWEQNDSDDDLFIVFGWLDLISFGFREILP